jgi:putative iron-dependent peroxidase
VATPQTGIFALGDASHTYLEFSLNGDAAPAELVTKIVDIHEPHTTVGGANFVIGFRPELWRRVAPDCAPAELTGFNEPLQGARGYTMPATQSDAWTWIAGSSYDVVFDLAKDVINALDGVATLDREIVGWSYRHSRDLTGFEDGTENPSLLEAPAVATIPAGAPGAGGSILLFQQWRHDWKRWNALSDEKQEKVMGRTKPDSVQLEDDVMPSDAHVPRNVIVVDGNELDIFRRNVPYGSVVDHGTVFVGFGADQYRLDRMLRRMAGAEDGVRDALTFYSTPLTGAYYFVPPVDALLSFKTPEEDD